MWDHILFVCSFCALQTEIENLRKDLTGQRTTLEQLKVYLWGVSEVKFSQFDRLCAFPFPGVVYTCWGQCDDILAFMFLFHQSQCADLDEQLKQQQRKSMLTNQQLQKEFEDASSVTKALETKMEVAE